MGIRAAFKRGVTAQAATAAACAAVDANNGAAPVLKAVDADIALAAAAAAADDDAMLPPPPAMMLSSSPPSSTRP